MDKNKTVKGLNNCANESSFSNEEQMEEFEGSRAGTKIYMCPNKYLYRMDRGTHGDAVLYYKCSEKNCTGRAISYHGLLNYRSKHSHGPQLAQAEAHRFRAELRRRASSETGHLETIYMQTQVLYREGAVQDGCAFAQVRTSMLRARNANRPPTPKTLVTAAISIQDPKFVEAFAFSLGPGQRNLYHGIVTAPNGERAMILKSADILDFIQMHNHDENALHLYVDSSYAITTTTGGCKHFMTINLEYRDHGFPFVFALMEAKTYEMYVSVLAELKTILGDVTYTSMSIVHDDDLKNAIREIYPNIKIANSWLYYSAAIYKQAELLHLLDSENHEIRQLVRMAICLPLLPSELYIRSGWLLLWNYFNQHMDRSNISSFTLYMEYTWLSNDIFDFKRLTEYSDSSFRKSLMRTLGKERASFWTLYKSVQLLEHSYGLKLIRVFNNRERELVRNKSLSEFQRHLDTFVDVLSTKHDIEDFLKQLATKLNLVTWLIKKCVDTKANSNVNLYSDSDSDATDGYKATPKKVAKKKTRINRKSAISAAFIMDHNYMKKSVC